jgi:hypothetical protein
MRTDFRVDFRTVSLESDLSLTRRLHMRGCQKARHQGALAQASESESYVYRDSLLRLSPKKSCRSRIPRAEKGWEKDAWRFTQ